MPSNFFAFSFAWFAFGVILSSAASPHFSSVALLRLPSSALPRFFSSTLLRVFQESCLSMLASSVKLFHVIRLLPEKYLVGGILGQLVRVYGEHDDAFPVQQRLCNLVENVVNIDDAFY